MKSIIKSASAAIIAAFSISVNAETFTFSTEQDLHNMIMFQINHAGFSNSIGHFTKFSGKIDIDEENLSEASVSATIDMNSVSLAQSALWHEHTTNTFFELEEHPNMTFSSTKVESLGDGKLAVTGDLTMLGVTKPVVLDAQINKIGDNLRGDRLAGFSASTSLKRSDYGMDEYIPVIGDEVKITIEIEAFPETEEE